MNARFFNSRNILKTVMLIAGLFLDASFVLANTNSRLESDTITQVKRVVKPLLQKYCGEYCMVIGVRPRIVSDVAETMDLGFENMSESSDKISYRVRDIKLSLQIDQRVSDSNRDRLGKILENHLYSISNEVEFDWVRVEVPQYGEAKEDDEKVREGIESNVGIALSRVISRYCPNDCMLSKVEVSGEQIDASSASEFPRSQVRKLGVGRQFYKINSVDVGVLINERLDNSTRNQILKIMDTKTQFASPMNFVPEVSLFPVTPEQEEKNKSDQDDPYGLEKLRKMLVMFRDLAGTKEIISKSTTDRLVDTKSVATNSSSLNSSISSSTKNNRLSTTDSSTSSGMDEGILQSWGLLIAALMVIGGIVLLAVLRYSQVKKDAELMVSTKNPMALKNGEFREDHDGADGYRLHGSDQAETSEELRVRVKQHTLKQEIIDAIMASPKVAKECFSRMLQEEGVEETSKYIQILGKVVFFQLLDEPSLKRDLFTLSEYVHQSSFEFSLEDEIDLLYILKNKIQAAEIKVLSTRSADQFDFLSRLDSEQIFNLIVTESAQVQSIVLTQINQSRRSTVIDYYNGSLKADLMEELCQADAIPKEFLWNVAKALKKKVETRPEFDTENLRSSDVLLDIMERATIGEQRDLMSNLQKTNSEAARGVKLKLITIEMLPYLRDGHLLEIVLGMDRMDLLTFLAGTRDHIRDLLLNKAPSELAESWWEDLENMASVDDQSYKLTEMKIFTRIRNLASNGSISLLDINDMMFPETYQEEFIDESTMPNLSDSSSVA